MWYVLVECIIKKIWLHTDLKLETWRSILIAFSYNWVFLLILYQNLTNVSFLMESENWLVNFFILSHKNPLVCYILNGSFIMNNIMLWILGKYWFTELCWASKYDTFYYIILHTLCSLWKTTLNERMKIRRHIMS